MISAAAIPEMRVYCDDSQAEQNTASLPASASSAQCGCPDSVATTRNCGARSELRAWGRSDSNILSPPQHADKSEIYPQCRLVRSARIGRAGFRKWDLRAENLCLVARSSQILRLY